MVGTSAGSGIRMDEKKSTEGRLAKWFIATPIMIPVLSTLGIAGDPTRAYAIGNAFGFPHDSLAFKLTLPFEFLTVNFLTSTLMFVQFAQLAIIEKITSVAANEVESLR